MRPINTLFFCLIFSLTLSAQTFNFTEYYGHANKATKYYYQEKYDSAKAEFIIAFNNTPYVHSKYISRALVCAKKTKDNDFAMYVRTRQMEHPPLNNTYKKQVDSLFNTDQKIVRNKKNLKMLQQFRQCVEKKNCDSTRYAMLAKHNKQSGIIDSTNGAKLISLIKLYGFPSEQLVGAEAYHDAIIILVHFDSDWNNVVLGDILKTALATGAILPKDYAWIIDRHSENTLYYTIPMGMDKLTKEQRDNVDSLRVSIGLPKLDDAQIMVLKKNSVRIKYLD